MTTAPSKRIGCSPWAFIGCGCGFIAMLGIILIFLLLSLERVWERQAPNRNRQAIVHCQDNLIHLRLAIQSFEKDHQRLPASIDELQRDHRYYEDISWFTCPLTTPGDRAYQYHPNANSPEDPLITCERHGQGLLLLQRNGHLRLPKESLHLFSPRNAASSAENVKTAPFPDAQTTRPGRDDR